MAIINLPSLWARLAISTQREGNKRIAVPFPSLRPCTSLPALRRDKHLQWHPEWPRCSVTAFWEAVKLQWNLFNCLCFSGPRYFHHFLFTEEIKVMPKLAGSAGTSAHPLAGRGNVVSWRKPSLCLRTESGAPLQALTAHHGCTSSCLPHM